VNVLAAYGSLCGRDQQTTENSSPPATTSLTSSGVIPELTVIVSGWWRPACARDSARRRSRDSSSRRATASGPRSKPTSSTRLRRSSGSLCSIIVPSRPARDARKKRKPPFCGAFLKRMKGLEPSTFCMANAGGRSRRFAPVRRNLPFAATSTSASERQRTRANAECSHCSHRHHWHDVVGRRHGLRSDPPSCSRRVELARKSDL
jgi:hypothetical protein